MTAAQDDTVCKFERIGLDAVAVSESGGVIMVGDAEDDVQVEVHPDGTYDSY